MSKSNKDFTQGNPLKLLTAFFLPMLIGNIVQQLYSMADSIIIGQFVGQGPFAAIGATMPVLSVMIVVIIGFTMGISICTAQYVGAKNTAKVRDIVGTAFLIAAVLSVALMILGISFAGPVLRLTHTPEDILDDARIYLVFNFATCIGPIAYNMFSNILRSAGDSRNPLAALIISSVLNILLDLVFVLVFHWGVVGVAVATGISQIISAVYCILILRFKNTEYWCRKENLGLHTDIIRDILKYGMPVAASRLFTSLGGVYIQSLINSYGSTVVAGYTAASKLDQLALQSLVSVGIAVSTFAGQNAGARKPERIRQGIRASWVLVLASSLVFGGLLYFCGGSMVRLFISGEHKETIDVAVSFLKIITPFYLIGGCMYIYMEAMRGIGEVAVPMAGSFTELIAKAAAAWILSRLFSYQALWFAWPAGWILSSALLLIYYYGFLWKKSRAFMSDFPGQDSTFE